MRLSVLSLLPALLLACDTGPKAILYGEELCKYCNMTIVDQRYAAQIVTTKGKTYNFDAIECMIHFQKQETVTPRDIAGNYINTFTNPGQWLDAASARYLISPQLPSPMGMNLTAFDTSPEATQALENYPGQIYAWEALLQSFSTPYTQ